MHIELKLVTQSSTVLSAGRGVCMMSNSWRDKQHPNLINFIATFLAANSYRLNFLSVSPVSTAILESHRFPLACLLCIWPENWLSVFQDFIFNNGGTSVAFVFETNWDSEKEAAVFSRWGRETLSGYVCYALHLLWWWCQSWNAFAGWIHWKGSSNIFMLLLSFPQENKLNHLTNHISSMHLILC